MASDRQGRVANHANSDFCSNLLRSTEATAARVVHSTDLSLGWIFCYNDFDPRDSRCHMVQAGSAETDD